MRVTSVRPSLFVLGFLLAAPVGGQPARGPVDGVRPAYTAFPDVKPSARAAVVKAADGSERAVLQQAAAVPLPPLPALGNDPAPLRRVQFEQMQEGLDYLKRVKETARLAAQHPDDARTAAVVAGEVCLLAAELEADPAKRVAWFEARVRLLKEGEESVTVYVLQGNLPVTALHGARFERLRAEADLLKLKAEVEKGKK